MVIVTLALLLLLLTTLSVANSASQTLAKFEVASNKQWVCAKHVLSRFGSSPPKLLSEKTYFYKAVHTTAPTALCPALSASLNVFVISNMTMRMYVIVSTTMALLCAAQCIY